MAVWNHRTTPGTVIAFSSLYSTRKIICPCTIILVDAHGSFTDILGINRGCGEKDSYRKKSKKKA